MFNSSNVKGVIVSQFVQSNLHVRSLATGHLACVAGFRKGRGRELGRALTRLKRLPRRLQATIYPDKVPTFSSVKAL